MVKLKGREDHEFYYNTNAGILMLAGKLRKNQTLAEKILWQALRRRNLKGHKFRRQHPIGKYIADFYCHSVKLVVEVDGSVHDTPESKERDAERDQEMIGYGLCVLRFTNDQVNNKLEWVLENILQVIVEKEEKSPPPGSFPQTG